MRGTHPERALESAAREAQTLRAGEHLLVACSGGSDSVGLAALLASVAGTLQLRLTLAHVNHGLRPSAWQDEAVALRAGAALGVPVKVEALHLQRRSEAALREARYAALERMARACGANAVATGHTAADQTETVLLALFRGSGPDGLAGIPARRELAHGIDLVRPLLAFDREAVRAYARFAGLPYAIDPSNDDLSLRRNAVRRTLAELRPLFPGLDAAVARAARLVGEEVAQAPRAVLRRQVRRSLREQQALAGTSFVHIEAAARALERSGSGRFAMGGGMEVRVDKGRLTVHREGR